MALYYYEVLILKIVYCNIQVNVDIYSVDTGWPSQWLIASIQYYKAVLQ